MLACRLKLIGKAEANAGKLIHKKGLSSTIPMPFTWENFVYRRVVLGDKRVISNARPSLTGFFAGYR